MSEQYELNKNLAQMLKGGVIMDVTTPEQAKIPPALAYSNETAGNDMPSVGYATVYPLTMFLRILTAQMLILCVA